MTTEKDAAPARPLFNKNGHCLHTMHLSVGNTICSNCTKILLNAHSTALLLCEAVIKAGDIGADELEWDDIYKLAAQFQKEVGVK